MGERRSGERAGLWDQLDLLGDGGANHSHLQGVGARQGTNAVRGGGGGYLDECTSSEFGHGGSKKIARRQFANLPPDPREAALLDELDAMGLSSVMLQVAYTIGFDNFMAMWEILDRSYEALADNESGIYLRMQRLRAYKRYQRNRFIEALAAMGKTRQEIQVEVKDTLGEEVSERHTLRVMMGGRVKP